MTSLNREQHAASAPSTGKSLVLAGAGTGKTKTLVEKAKNLINSKVINPENILILTFSRKAAGEIKERIKSSIGPAAELITAATFHSLCLRVLKNYSDSVIRNMGSRHFPGVMNDDEAKSLFIEIITKRLPKLLGMPVSVVYDLASGLENLDRYTLMKLEKSGLDIEINEIKQKFIREKRKRNLIDFEDMMNMTTELLKENREIREEMLKSFQYILVDEFQDTSRRNFQLISQLMPERGGNLFAVGDDWQSIYGFRNADVGYIIGIKKYFPDIKVYRLKMNYRSRAEIVRLSCRFIKNNRKRSRKKLKSHRGKGGEIRYHHVKSLMEEYETIAGIVTEEPCKSGTIAILCRNNWQVDAIKKSAAYNRLPRDDVEIMTMHSSKGLEFDTVVIAGVSDRIIPDISSDIEEERRLFYVALTRAGDRLHIILNSSDMTRLPRFGKELGVNNRSIQARTFL